MTRLIESVVAGLGSGAIYALVALGFVIIYKSTQVISFAQPALMMVGGSAVVFLAVENGLNFYLAVVIAVLFAALVALLVERLALRPMIGKPAFVVAIITIGVDVILRIFVNRFLGRDVRAVGDPWGLQTTRLGEVVVQHRHIAMLATAAVIVAGLYALFKYTRVGLAMRATAFDQEAALAQGVSVGLVFALSWMIAGGLAAVAGVFVGTGVGLSQSSWIVALKALPAIILGGLDSVAGAVVGGLVVGVIEQLVGTYQSQYFPWLGSNFSVVSPYVIMLVVMLIRPYGLFGTPEVERV